MGRRTCYLRAPARFLRVVPSGGRKDANVSAVPKCCAGTRAHAHTRRVPVINEVISVQRRRLSAPGRLRLGEAESVRLGRIPASGYGRGASSQAFPLSCKDFTQTEGVLCLLVKQRRVASTSEDGLIWRLGNPFTRFKYGLVKTKPGTSCFECTNLQHQGPDFPSPRRRRPAEAALIRAQPEWPEPPMFAEAIS